MYYSDNYGFIIETIYNHFIFGCLVQRDLDGNCRRRWNWRALVFLLYWQNWVENRCSPIPSYIIVGFQSYFISNFHQGFAFGRGSVYDRSMFNDSDSAVVIPLIILYFRNWSNMTVVQRISVFNFIFGLKRGELIRIPLLIIWFYWRVGLKEWTLNSSRQILI